MRANIFRFLVIVTALCLTFTSHTPIQGSGSEEETGSGYGIGDLYDQDNESGDL